MRIKINAEAETCVYHVGRLGQHEGQPHDQALSAPAAPNYLWYSYLIAYSVEAIAIVTLHKMTHACFELK